MSKHNQEMTDHHIVVCGSDSSIFAHGTCTGHVGKRISSSSKEIQGSPEEAQMQ